MCIFTISNQRAPAIRCYPLVMPNRLSRLSFLFLFSFLLQNSFSQDQILRTATDSLSLSAISSCKEISCNIYSVKVITNALVNARMRADLILEEREDLQDKIIKFNLEVADFYKTVDSLGDLYARNQKALDEYWQERKNFADAYRFVGTQPTVASMPAAGTNNRSNQGSMPPTGISTITSTTMGNTNSRIQKDIDERALAEKGRRLNSDHRVIDDNRKTLERKRAKLLAEGNYLNEMLQKNTDKLTEANNRMIEVVSFGKRANTILTDELKSSQKLDIAMLLDIETLTTSLSTRIRETQAIIVNLVHNK